MFKTFRICLNFNPLEYIVLLFKHVDCELDNFWSFNLVNQKTQVPSQILMKFDACFKNAYSSIQKCISAYEFHLLKIAFFLIFHVLKNIYINIDISILVYLIIIIIIS